MKSEGLSIQIKTLLVEELAVSAQICLNCTVEPVDKVGVVFRQIDDLVGIALVKMPNKLLQRTMIRCTNKKRDLIGAYTVFEQYDDCVVKFPKAVFIESASLVQLECKAIFLRRIIFKNDPLSVLDSHNSTSLPTY